MPDLEQYLKMHYSILLKWDGDDSWIARNPELKGCIADGRTVEEALASLEISRALWLEASLANGLEIPLPNEEA
jgi:predicted RNase H-like HicB family nuclease